MICVPYSKMKYSHLFFGRINNSLLMFSQTLVPSWWSLKLEADWNMPKWQKLERGWEDQLLSEVIGKAAYISMLHFYATKSNWVSGVMKIYFWIKRFSSGRESTTASQLKKHGKSQLEKMLPVLERLEGSGGIYCLWKIMYVLLQKASYWKNVFDSPKRELQILKS